MSFPIRLNKEGHKTIIKTNITHQDLENNILKYSDSAHSLTLIAVALLDPIYKNIEITVEYENIDDIINSVKHILAVWKQYSPIQSSIRSIKHNGKFEEEFEGTKLQKINENDTNLAYQNSKVILIDITSNDNDGNVSYKFKLYRWGENIPRILNINTL